MSFTHLITPQELNTQRQDNWVIVDVSHQLAAPQEGALNFLKERISGALFMDLNTQLSAPTNGHNGRHPLPSQEDFRYTVSLYGITPETQVIVYDQNNMFAPRLWWMLNWIGHQNVAILDGGLPAWKKESLPLDTSPLLNTTPNPKVKVANYPIKPSAFNTVNADDVMQNLTEKTLTIIDARAAGRYRGEGETLDPVGGHIPGALNRCFQENLNANNQFKTAEQLRLEFTEFMTTHGLKANQIVHQCGSGVTACHNLFSMSLAGLGITKLYPGSWSEWCSNPDRPVEK